MASSGKCGGGLGGGDGGRIEVGDVFSEARGERGPGRLGVGGCAGLDVEEEGVT